MSKKILEPRKPNIQPGTDRGAVVTRTVASQVIRRMLISLALAQFIASYAGSNMNVAINSSFTQT